MLRTEQHTTRDFHSQTLAAGGRRENWLLALAAGASCGVAQQACAQLSYAVSFLLLRDNSQLRLITNNAAAARPLNRKKVHVD
jgi:hypothetical protein